MKGFTVAHRTIAGIYSIDDPRKHPQAGAVVALATRTEEEP